MRRTLICLLFVSLTHITLAEDGYRLWLRYDRIHNDAVLKQYKDLLYGWYVDGQSPTDAVMRSELTTGLNGLLGYPIYESKAIKDRIVVFTTYQSPTMADQVVPASIAGKAESFAIYHTHLFKKKVIVVAGTDEAGKLYGMFHFLRLLQTHTDITSLKVESSPKISTRILNHWDNLDRTVERGYAGFSIWDWHRLPEYIDPRYTDYARANASIGINATVLTNVNANARLITPEFLEKAKVIADILRPYRIRVFLTARFSAPIEIGELKTADPLDAEVQKWWKKKTDEIYQYIPDFGGFLVKANSEGQPGPQNYGRSHADGANMLADAVAPHGGIVMWRAFVYDNNVPDDRARQAYSEFKPLDGTFRSNVIIQVKNGPIDFQPREPFHPLFGAMTSTPLMMEFQITQEYLGQATHLVFLPTQFQEYLRSDTYTKGPGSTVARVTDGTVFPQKLTAMAGVANIGTDRNWTGHLFGQANWYGFGRLAWDHTISDTTIADEWIRMTFGTDKDVTQQILPLMLRSHEVVVNSMTPLGLHQIMGPNHHYGAGPWVSKMSRADWTSTYYHKADSMGIGFNRTSTGSNATAQYSEDARRAWESEATCPEELLLWFHHVPWTRKMKSGRTLWDELCTRYNEGVLGVEGMSQSWARLAGKIDKERHQHVAMLLARQHYEAELWRNSCILYFQTFSKKAIPAGINVGDKPLEYYLKMEYPYAPGIRPRW